MKDIRSEMCHQSSSTGGLTAIGRTQTSNDSLSLDEMGNKKFSPSIYFGKKLTCCRKWFSGIIKDQFHKWSTSCSLSRRHRTADDLDNFIDETKSDDGDTTQSCVMSVSPVSILWSVLSIFVASTCTVTFFHPSWVIHPDHVHSFGVFRYCVTDVHSHAQVQSSKCINYGNTPFLSAIPSGAWQAACILYGGGCVLMCLTSVSTVMVLCADKYKHRRLAAINGYVQTVAVLFMAGGLLIYPLGFSSSFFRYYCGEGAGPYGTGHCVIGWSYMLSVMGVALSIFCPILSNFADVKYDEDDILSLV